MQHLWSAATWELQVNADAIDESTMAVPVKIPFSNDDGYKSEAGSFRIALNGSRRKKNV